MSVDRELVVISEFIAFANDVLNDKGTKNFCRLVKEKDLGPQQATLLKQVFSTFFSSKTAFSEFTKKDLILHKTGAISMGDLERKCSKKQEDKEAFEQYMQTFQGVYQDVRTNLKEFVTKLNLEPDSAEAKFMMNLFNEIGGEVIETIKSGGDTKDIASLLPKVFEMVKSGKIMSVLERLKDGSIKISKILRAFTVLVEQYENEGTIVPTAAAEDDVVIKED